MNYGYYRPGLPFVVKNLIIINAIVFVVTMFAQNFMYGTFSLFYFTSPFFKPFQLITYMFMHGGFWHIFFNMFSLYMFGSVLENYWGGKKFFLYYMVCGIGAGLINELVMYLQIAFAETPGLVEAAINRVPLSPRLPDWSRPPSTACQPSVPRAPSTGCCWPTA